MDAQNAKYLKVSDAISASGTDARNQSEIIVINPEEMRKKVKAGRKKKLPTIPKQIYWYKALLEDDLTKVLDARTLAPAFNKLDFERNEDHYLTDADGIVRYCILHCEERGGRSDYRVRLTFSKTDMALYGTLEKGGRTREIDASEQEGVNQIAHAVFFEGGYVGIEHNFKGPRANRITEFFSKKCDDVSNFSLNALYSKEGVEKFDELTNFRGIRIKAPGDKEHKALLKTLPLPEAVIAVMEQYEPDQASFELKQNVKSESKVHLLINSVLDAVRGGKADYSDYIELLAKPKTVGKSEWFDFSKQHLQSSTELIKLEQRQRIPSEEMFKRIEEAYNSSYDNIRNAKTLLKAT